MEKTKVTFVNDSRTITIDFEYNKENGNLDYNTVIEPPFDNPDDVNDGSLLVYLANTFMQSLVPSQEFNESVE